MTDTEPNPHDDPWLTVAEFAQEMRVRPVTVRAWIAKGQLKATRAGQRKWLVRRSELARMLEQDDRVEALPPRPVLRPPEFPEPDDRPPEMWERMAEQAVADERERQERD